MSTHRIRLRLMFLPLWGAVAASCSPAQRMPTARSFADAPVVAVIRQPLIDAPGESLTSEVLELAPGDAAPARRHLGTVFAIVLSGTVQVQRGGATPVVRHSGDSWTEAPGDAPVRIENPSTREPARVLGVFVAPTEQSFASIGH